MTLSRHARPAGFALAGITMLVAAAWVASALPRTTRPGVVATALTLDLTVVLPALYYALLGRRSGWPALGTVPVFLAGLGVAGWLLPPEHRTLWDAIGWGVPAAEVLVTGYVAVRAARAIRRRLRRGAASVDVLERWRAATREAFPARALSEVVAYEAALWHYLWQGVRRAGKPPASASRFSYHAGYGPVVAVFLGLGMAELAAGHLLLRLWSETAAWVHFALGAYSLCWLAADYFAAQRRPLQLGEETLLARAGLRWTARVPLAQIAAVEQTHTAPGDALSMSLVGGANVLVTLHAPVAATGPYGLARRAAKLHLRVSEPGRFAALLRRRLGDGCPSTEGAPPRGNAAP